MIVAADAPVRRDALVEFGGDTVVGVRDATPADPGPVHDVLMPGMIDAHSHARGIPLVRQGIDGGSLERFLVQLRALTPLDHGDDALVAAADAVHGGITSMQVIHHSFAGPQTYAAQARALLDGCAAAGIRAFVSLAVTDRDEYAPVLDGRAIPGIPQPDRGLDAGGFAEVAAVLRGRRGLAQIDALGPVAPQWCSDGMLATIAASRARGRMHSHLLESARQRLAPGTEPVSRLHAAGLLDQGSSLAHGVWLDDAQIERLAAAGAVIVHCPGSNRRLGVGTCRVRRLLDAGVAVALGLDSNGAAVQPDMFAEMRAALRTAEDAEAPLTAAEALMMATGGGARALARPELGTLTPGSAADAVALELPTAVAAADPVEEVVRRADAGAVVSRWVAGRATGPSAAATLARARCETAIERDAGARAQRLSAACDAWSAVDKAWRRMERRAELTPRES